MSGTVLLEPDALALLAGRLEGMAGDLLLVAGTVTATAADPHLLAAGLLDPVGVARCEAALAVLLAPGALPGCAARLGEAALRVRAVRAAALLADDAESALVRAEAELVEHVPQLEDGVAVAGAAEALLLQVEGVPPGLAGAAVHEQSEALGQVLDLAVRLLPEGPGSAREVAPAAGPPPPRPAGLGDLFARIAALPPGQVAVLRVGERPPRWVVLLPGIHSLGVTDDPQDLYGALRAARTTSTTYTRAVSAALLLAGAAAGDEVMLVGHSQGGLAALDLAGDPVFAERYRVTHAVAAGSPVTGKHVPAETQVLTVENRADLVPHLDLAESVTAGPVPGRTVYSYRHDRGTIGANHGVATEYGPVTGPAAPGAPPAELAYATSASAAFAAQPAVARFLASAAAYLRPQGPVRTSYFAVSDRPPAGPAPAPSPTPAPRAQARVPRQRTRRPVTGRDAR